MKKSFFDNSSSISISIINFKFRFGFVSKYTSVHSKNWTIYFQLIKKNQKIYKINSIGFSLWKNNSNWSIGNIRQKQVLEQTD